MKKQTTQIRNSEMNADAYAGFLKLWLTPPTREPKNSPELEAYLRYANERQPTHEGVWRRRQPRRAA